MSKPYLTYLQQIQKLKNEKGLIINDEIYAKQVLTNIGYFSLIGGYKNLFINPMTRKYEEPTTIEDIVALYYFDEDLRQLTFKYLIKIEQKIRQLISDSFCKQYGEDQNYYLSASSYNPSKKMSASVNKLIRILDYNANKNNEHDYLVHQRNVYGNVPLWVNTKVMTFGQLSKFYSLLQSREQTRVSKVFVNVSERSLTQYLNALTMFRNVCAHNERLFSFHLQQRAFPDTIIHKKLGIPQKGMQYIQGKEDYFGVIIAFRYLLSKQDFLEYKRGLKKIIKTYLNNSSRITKAELLKEMGMPSNWESIARYKL